MALTLTVLIATAITMARPAGTRVLSVADTQWLPANQWLQPHFPAPSEPTGTLTLGRFGDRSGLQVTVFAHGLDGQPRDLGLLLNAVEGPSTVYMNGREVGTADTSAPYLSRPGARDAVFRIPSEIIRPGLNRIDVLLQAPVMRGLGAPMVVGRQVVLESYLGRARWVGERLRWALIASAAVLLLLALAAAGLERASPLYLAFAAAASAAGARAWLQFAEVDEFGAYWPLVDLMLLTATFAVPALALRDDPKAGRLIRVLGSAVIVALALALVAVTSVPTWAAISAAVAVSLSAILGLWAIGRWARRPLPNTTAGKLGRGAGLVLAQAAVVSGAWAVLAPPAIALPAPVDVIYGLAMVGLLAVAAVVTGRAALRTGIAAGRARLDLGRVVRRQREEIRDASLALEQEARRTAVLEERQRFARDVHDGIGGHIASLIARVRSGRIDIDQLEGELVGGLAELRLLVDSLDAAGESLSQALAAFHARAQPQVEAAGMRLDWRQPDPMEIETLDPRWILNLYRLLQEAIANAVQHSGADRLLIAIDNPRGRRLTIRVEDNGEGFEPGTSGGRGLANMAHRARALDALLEMGPGPDGRGVRILLEVDVPERGPAEDA